MFDWIQMWLRHLTKGPKTSQIAVERSTHIRIACVSKPVPGLKKTARVTPKKSAFFI